jgi:hypothetical protein
MCLEVSVLFGRGEKERVTAEAVARASGLHVSAFRTDDGRRAFHLAVGDGCSCDLLPAKFDSRSPTWSLLPNVLPRLEKALTAVSTRSSSFTFRALWRGLDALALSSLSVSVKDLLQRIRQNAIGNGVEYVVGPG